MVILSKKQLAMILSRLKPFETPNFELEQYQTDSEIAAEIAWNMFYRREIEDKTIADLGTGTGILGLSALLLGAKKVYLVDIDEKALKIARENLKAVEELTGENLSERCVFVHKDVLLFGDKVDVAIQNPPFGIQGKTHADRAFLKKAFTIAGIVYSFHKAESKKFIEALAKDNGFKVTTYWEFDWPVKQTMRFHAKKVHHVKVGCWRLEAA
jgi:putative methylase